MSAISTNLVGRRCQFTRPWAEVTAGKLQRACGEIVAVYYASQSFPMLLVAVDDTRGIEVVSSPGIVLEPRSLFDGNTPAS